MKRRILLLCATGMFTIGSLLAQNQYKIQFSYDSAGNQTLRDRVCVNCGTSKQAVDSTLAEDIALKEDIVEELSGLGETIGESSIVAYPNPVTNQITVEWQDNQKKVAQIVLFSGIGQQLFQKAIRSNQGNLNLDFTRYPQGRYIISVFYTDNTKETFHVLKR